MADAEELKRKRARELRYRKPIVKELNIWTIREELSDIWEECTNVEFFLETDEESLIEAMAGDEDEAYEFRMMFSDLYAECEQMNSDLEEMYVPDCFDDLFVAAGCGEFGGGLLGYDTYEQDYFGLQCTDDFAEQGSQKRLERLTKKELIEAVHQCLRIVFSYIGLRHRYDCLKASMDILKEQNTAHLQLAKQIEDLYEKAANDGFYSWKKSTREYERLLDAMPQEAFL